VFVRASRRILAGLASERRCIMRQVWHIFQTALGVTFAICFVLAIAELAYLAHNGTSAPDKTHVVALQSHGRTFYVSSLQWGTFFALDLIWAVSGVLAVVIQGVFRSRAAA
jgi:hypothetical protein